MCCADHPPAINQYIYICRGDTDFGSSGPSLVVDGDVRKIRFQDQAYMGGFQPAPVIKIDICGCARVNLLFVRGALFLSF